MLLLSPSAPDLAGQRAILLEALRTGPVSSGLAKLMGVTSPRLRVIELRRQGFVIEQEATGGNGRRAEVVYSLLPAGAALQIDFFKPGWRPKKSPAGCGDNLAGQLFSKTNAANVNTIPATFPARVGFRQCKRGRL